MPTCIEISQKNVYQMCFSARQEFYHHSPGNKAFFDYTDPLILSFNQIEILETGTFFKVPINELQLNDNKIREIENGSFDSQTIGFLCLLNNSLNQISGVELAGPDNLEILHFSNNGISKIEKAFAKYLGNVTELNLSDNPIQETGERCFVWFNQGQ